ncbi:MAG: hypothetical protein AAGA66_05445 [Bacteroidota bacterium]
MKFVEYLLKFGFMFGLSIVLMVFVSSTFWETASEEKNPTNILSATRIHVSFWTASDKYLQIVAISENRNDLIRRLYIPDRETKTFVHTLLEAGLINSDDLSAELPVEINCQKHDCLFKEEGGAIGYLLFDENILLGGSSVLRIAILYLLAVLFGLLGLATFLLSTLAFYQTVLTYRKTGRFPELSNSVISKMDGIKYLIRGFKN